MASPSLERIERAFLAAAKRRVQVAWKA